jgi:hypothetical protein
VRRKTAAPPIQKLVTKIFLQFKWAGSHKTPQPAQHLLPNSHHFHTYPQLNHSFPQLLSKNQQLFHLKPNAVNAFRFVEKIKHPQFVCKVVKYVILCRIMVKLFRFSTNDWFSW